MCGARLGAWKPGEARCIMQVSAGVGGRQTNDASGSSIFCFVTGKWKVFFKLITRPDERCQGKENIINGKVLEMQTDIGELHLYSLYDRNKQ